MGYRMEGGALPVPDIAGRDVPAGVSLPKPLVKDLDREVGRDPARAGPWVITQEADRLWEAATSGVPDGVGGLALLGLAGRVSLTVEETAFSMGISVGQVRSAIRRGDLPSLKVGATRLLPVRALERHLEALAYAESGALSAWEKALGDAAQVRFKTAVRRQRALNRDRDRKRKERG